MDDGDDLLPIRRKPARPPDLLSYQERLSDSATRHQRAGSKISTPTIRPNVVRRVDAGAEIMCIRLLVAQLTRGEFQVWIALKEGVLFRPVLPKHSREIVRRTWFCVPPPARSATVEQVAKHYGYTEASVRRMDQSARRLLAELRERAGLIGDEPRVPVWPAVNSDENLLRYLYGPKSEQ